MQNMLAMVKRFNQEIIGINIPERFTALNSKRIKARVNHMKEELDEALEASNAHDQADAWLDVIYLALGALVEMGVAPGPSFEVVHEANMRKQRGEVSKRPGSEGYDAIKPEGWTAPDLMPYLDVTKAELLMLRHISPVLKRITELRAQKGNDYNTGVQLEDYFPLGHKSYFQMVFLKTKRIQSILEVMDQGKPLNFEGLEDTILDLLNYATFYAEFIEAEKKKAKTQNLVSKILLQKAK